MGIRKPTEIWSTTQTGVADTTLLFSVPDDVTNLTAKVYTADTFLDAGSVDVYVQTTDDGGTTWYDCAHFAQLTTAIAKADALWASVPVGHTSSAAQNTFGYIGAAADKSISASKNSGLPILDKLVRIKLDYATAATNGGLIIKVYGSQRIENTRMVIRDPAAISSITETTVATGAQTVNYNISIPQDTSSLIVKQYGTAMGGGTCDIYIQTTDDGGTTWYDCGHFAQFATSTITSANALWAVVPVNAAQVTVPGSGYIGAATAASVAASRMSGLPLLSTLVRISFVYTANTSNTGINVRLLASQG